MTRKVFQVNSLYNIFRELAKKKPHLRLRHFTREQSWPIKEVVRQAEADMGDADGHELLTKEEYYWGEDGEGVFISRFGPYKGMTGGFVFREAQ
jgi:hypothetical protein